MTTDELLRRILAFLPYASIGEDLDGQIIIYTDMKKSPEGTLVRFADDKA